MKILHICTQDSGGAGKAALRLHLGLKGIGVDSKMVVLYRSSQNNDVISLQGKRDFFVRIKNKLRGKANSLWARLTRKNIEPFSASKAPYAVSKHPLVKEADIIALHWIAGMIDYQEFFPNVKNKPIIWRLSDINPFTGGCHYAGNCVKYESGCGSCPKLNSSQPDDRSRRTFRIKKSLYKNLDLCLVAPSRYMAECAGRSGLFKDFRIEVIPNGLPINIFKKHEKSRSRTLLKLPQDKIIILFGSGYKSEIKGLQYLIKALNLLRIKLDFTKIALVLFGQKYPKSTLSVDPKMDIYQLSYIDDEELLSCVYSAGDFLVMPSLQESFGQICLESLACGTPVVGFKTGGLVDMIRPGVTGFLSEIGDAEGLAQNIEWMIDHPKEREEMGANARRLVEEEYALEIQANRYRKLYESIS